MSEPPASAPQATAPNARKRIASPRVELTVEREAGIEVSRTMTLDGERFLLGTHRKNDLVLEDPRVSRFHCSILRSENAWRVIDSGSLNGTHLAGVGVRDADLPATCTLVLGDSIVRLRELPAATHVDVLDQASFGDLYGQSIAMQRLFAILEKIANSEANVLVEGESGTGKELVAAELVRRGPRARKPFVIIDCSSILSQPDRVGALWSRARLLHGGRSRARGRLRGRSRRHGLPRRDR